MDSATKVVLNSLSEHEICKSRPPSLLFCCGMPVYGTSRCWWWQDSWSHKSEALCCCLQSHELAQTLCLLPNLRNTCNTKNAAIVHNEGEIKGNAKVKLEPPQNLSVFWFCFLKTAHKVLQCTAGGHKNAKVGAWTGGWTVHFVFEHSPFVASGGFFCLRKDQIIQFWGGNFLDLVSMNLCGLLNGLKCPLFFKT